MIVNGGENTKSKWLVIISIFLILLCLNAVSASEMDDDSNEIISSADDQEIVSDDVGSFTELSNYISSEMASGNYVIELNKSYKFIDGDNIVGIDIGNRNHNITINGNDHCLDGSDSVRIFRVLNYHEILLENILFKNANSANGAVYSLNEHLTVKNCTFVNNSGTRGGATYIRENTQIIDCTFENNSASLYGGAIFTNGANTIITGSTFKSNNATRYGGAIYVENNYCSIINSNFENNNAVVAGAIISVANNTLIDNCVFNNNSAGVNRWFCGGAVLLRNSTNSTINNTKFYNNTGNSSGGAVSVYYSHDITIDSSIFDGNKADHDGGAVVLFHSHDVTFKNSNFTRNEVTDTDTINPGSYGSAIRSADSTADINISNCTFDSNIAHNNAGAIEYYGTNLTIVDSRFINNIAYSDGGAIYCHSDGFVNLTGCNFTNNTVFKGYGYDTSTKLTGVAGPYTSGAVLLRKNPSKESLNSYIVNCRFEDNSAPYLAGALCIRTETPDSHHAIVTDSYFNGNNASFGSAIYLYELATLDISNTIFGKNRANSSSLDISVDKKVSFYPSDVNITVTLQGWDNIANAIWNGGNATSFFKNQQIVEDFSSVTSGDVSHIRLCNITYEVYHDGELKTVTAYTDALQNPVSGYDKADVGNNIWQDTLEDAQNITLKIFKVDDASNDSNSGILSASIDNSLNVKTETLVAEVSAPLTEISGAMSNIQKSLKPGNYTVKASHARDVYYTEIESETDFQILALNITKEANVTVVGNDSLVNFTITVKNEGPVELTDIFVEDPMTDTVFDGLEIDDCGIIDENPDGEKAIASHDDISARWLIYNLKGNESYRLWATARTTKLGEITNTASAYLLDYPEDSYINDSANITVIPDNLTVVKTVNETECYVGNLVKFAITVTNAGEVNSKNINVTDLLDSAFEVQEIGNKSYLVYNDTEMILWNLPSLNTGNSTTFEVIIKILANGTYNNTAVVKSPTSNESNSTVNVTGLKIPTHVSVGNVTTYPGRNVTIPINVTADDNKTFSGNITIYLPDGSNQTVEIINGTGNVTWFVPENYVPGVYNDTAKYDGNETYLPSSGNGTITVLPIPTHTTVGNVTTFPGMNVTIPVNVTADDNKPFNGNVTIKLPDGSNKTVEITNGTGNVTWFVPENYVPGVYNDTAKYNGNETYLPSSGNGTITVLPIPTITTIGNVTGKAGQNVTIPVNVTADNNKPVNGNVTVELPDGSNQTVEITNGTGNIIWTIPDDYNGTYSDNASYPGNETYLPSNGTGIITVIPKIPTHVSVGNITTYPDTDVTIPINVTADDNIPFNGNVTITFPDGSNKTVEIVNGTGNVTWHVPSDYTPDVYNDTVSFPGNEDYFPSSGNGTITVLPIPTHTSVDNVTGIMGENVTIPINVTADDNKPVNGNVTVELPDGSNQTVEIVNGTGNATWHVPEEYVPQYNDTAKFPGNETYLPSNSTGTITVLPIPTHVSVGNITTYPGTDITIPINVTTDDGVPFNGNVTITLPDGSKKTVEIINGTGSVDWTIPMDYDGNYDVKVSFNGTNCYYPSNGTGIITVIPDVVPPVADDNKTVQKSVDIKSDNKATGNPILVLLAVLALLGISIKRRK